MTNVACFHGLACAITLKGITLIYNGLKMGKVISSIALGGSGAFFQFYGFIMQIHPHEKHMLVIRP